MGAVWIGTYPEPPFREEEILRYAGCPEATEEMEQLLRRCLAEVRDKLDYRVCTRRFPIRDRGEVLDLGFMTTGSVSLKEHLAGCEEVVLLGATVGLGLDRMINRYSRVAPARALMLQAIGAERIEALCDLYCRELAQKEEQGGRYLRSRFSPGYGDLPLEVQKDLFRVLDCPGKIGVSLNDSMLMSPSKSVTALIGVGRERVACGAEKCAACQNYDCVYRKVPRE